MPKFRKKPVVIDAEQFNGHNDPPGVFRRPEDHTPYVVTIHGQRVYLSPGDWVVPEPDGVHYYPIKDEVFQNTYEAVGLDILDILKPVAAVAIAQQLQAPPSTLVELAALRRFRDQIMSLRAEVGVIAENTTPGPEDKDILAEFAKRIDALFQQSPVDIRGTPISEVPPEVLGC